MKINKKTLGAIVLASSVGLAFGSGDGGNKSEYNSNPEYAFNGRIGLNKVRFWEGNSGKKNVLEVKRPWGTTIVYGDLNDDFKLDYVVVSGRKRKNPRVYSMASKNPKVTALIEGISQKQFDAYLEEIFKINMKPLKNMNRRK